ncbi:hypothetical protein BDQ17DRAFT_1431937 [Cyathus striatus]|nr:hypothetical protein BDQ17DRAFT_1431937 [Cyathus striatus]
MHDGEDATMHAEASASDDGTAYPASYVSQSGTRSNIYDRALEAFHTTYDTLLLKASFTTLRKRDRKRERQRLGQAAKRKKILEDVVAVGPKGDSGRRIGRRKEKLLREVEEKRRRWKERERMNME